MSSYHPASSSAQQPFTTPQPAPVSSQTTATNATSPPTKQSLKSWWKQFRPPARGNSEAQVEQPTGIFGVALRQSITYANVAISLVDAEGKSYIYGYVPIVVAKCGVFLKENATNVEGIFRLSGSEKRIKELKTIFDSPDRYGKGLDWGGYTVHDAANVLRRYLNQLPEPIVPLDLYGPFRDPLRGHTMQAVGDTEGPQLKASFDVDNAIKTYQRLITELPPLNRQLLLYILDLLAVFASKSDENRMTSQNLSAIFQPGILSHPEHDMAPKEYRLSQDVLIFLIENQDHFLIGMRGTAADEQTVQEVQNGGTPPPGTPKTPGHKTGVARTASNASAGADSVRKYGGVRRNVSVSSKHSRQSNGAASPGSPGLSSTSGVHRSNTVPSKRSPALKSGRLMKHSGSPLGSSSPTTTSPGERITAPRGQSPAPVPTTERSGTFLAPGNGLPTVSGATLAPEAYAVSAVASQERLLGDQQEFATPSKERSVSNLFQRSPTVEGDKKQPNKLRKKRGPGSANPSAHSSTQSLSQHSPALSPALPPTNIVEHPTLETIQSDELIAAPPNSNSQAEPVAHHITMEDDVQQPTEQKLKERRSLTTSLHSRSSANEHSDMDHRDDTTMGEEQRERRSRWRVSRQRDNPAPLGNNLSPRKGLGSDAAGASTSSIGSSARPRKSLTGDTVAASESTLVGAHPQSSTESGHGATTGNEEKKGPLGWIKNKMREKREERSEKEAGKERTKSPSASNDRQASSMLPSRGKSMDVSRGKSMEVRREDNHEPLLDARALHQDQPHPV